MVPELSRDNLMFTEMQFEEKVKTFSRLGMLLANYTERRGTSGSCPIRYYI